MIIYWRQN